MRILFIEDDYDFREVVTEVLEQQGHEVITAEDGEQGYQHLLNLDPVPDAIIVDLGIPGVSGAELIRRVREELKDRHPALPILLMSGENDLAEIAERLNLRFFLKKPPSIEELARTVEAMGVGRPEIVS